MTAKKVLQQMPKDDNFLNNGKYSKTCPEWFLKKFNRIDKNLSYFEFLKSAFGVVFTELDNKKFRVARTKNWYKSRFISANTILQKRLRTCGTMSILAACGLRHLGIPTKLIHGYLHSENGKSRHAWIEVYNPGSQRFIPMDITRKGFKISNQHKRVKECVDWAELEAKEWDTAGQYRDIK